MSYDHRQNTAAAHDDVQFDFRSRFSESFGTHAVKKTKNARLKRRHLLYPLDPFLHQNAKIGTRRPKTK